jgi:hypothetical protein
VSVIAFVVLFRMRFRPRVCALLCLTVCAGFAGLSLCVGCVAVSAGVIGVEQAGVSYRAVVRSVLWSEVRSAGVRRRSIIRIRIRKKQDTRKHVKAITRPWCMDMT